MRILALMTSMLCAAFAVAQQLVAPMVLMGPSAPATYTFENTSTASGYNTNGSTTFDISTVVPSNSGNCFILAMVAYSGDNGTPSGIARNGQSFTNLGTYDGEAWHIRAYGLTAPTSGTYNTTVTVSASGIPTGEIWVGIWVFTGVNQTAPTGSIAGNFNWGQASASVAVGSASGDYCAMFSYTYDYVAYSSAASGTTHDWSASQGKRVSADHKVATGTSTTVGINWNSADMWVAGAIAVKPN